MVNSWIVTSLVLVLVYDSSFSATLRNGRTDQVFCEGTDPLNNCTCDVKGRTALYKNGTRCYVLHEGYNGELDYKRGTCKDGKCEYNVIQKGCQHVQEKAKKQMELGEQIGCAFTCYNRVTQKVEFGYYYEGAPCQHTVGPGNYTNGTCVKKNEGNVICEVLPLSLAC